MQREEEVKWAERYCKGRSKGSCIYRMVLAFSVYHLWIERNNRIFQKKTRTTQYLTRRIIQETHLRASLFPKLTWHMLGLNF